MTDLTIQQTRVALDGLYCGCGNPEEALKAIHRLLKLHPLYENRAEFEEWIPDTGLEMLLLHLLDAHGLNEHGGWIGGAWLTDKGKALLAALDRYSMDEIEPEPEEPACVHGFASQDGEAYEEHDCMAAGEPSLPFNQYGAAE